MIDPQAQIHPSAIIAENVTIGPWSVIGADVTIAEGTVIESHVVIKGPTKIGKNNHIFQFASVGEEPQDKKFAGEKTYLEIGDNNNIREFVTINRGTVQGGSYTKIGSNNLLMAYVHVAHDCIIGNNNVFSNNASLAGHVEVHDHAVLGGFSAIHQFCRVGDYSFIAGGALITKDVLPYVLVSGKHNPAACGLNVVGLKRQGFTELTIKMLRQAYKVIYRQGLLVKDAIQELENSVPSCPEVNNFLAILKTSERGFH